MAWGPRATISGGGCLPTRRNAITRAIAPTPAMARITATGSAATDTSRGLIHAAAPASRSRTNLPAPAEFIAPRFDVSLGRRGFRSPRCGTEAACLRVTVTVPAGDCANRSAPPQSGQAACISGFASRRRRGDRQSGQSSDSTRSAGISAPRNGGRSAVKTRKVWLRFAAVPPSGDHGAGGKAAGCWPRSFAAARVVTMTLLLVSSMTTPILSYCFRMEAIACSAGTTPN